MPVCAHCGSENGDAARFCSACGSPLAAVAVASPEERKVVTVLFADVTGSTALGERLDPEGLKEVMVAFFAAMRNEIEAEGGTVEKFIGDAVVAAFGVPRVHEDDPARALRAALRMRTRLGALNETLAERYGVELELRIGINTGEVIAVTDPRPGEALATGDAVNAAARLEQMAEPGTVLVSERTAQAARGFRFAAARELELRGRALPLRAVELVAEQAIAEGALSGLRAPLVGRRRELELLTTTYRRAVEEGRPHLVTVYGEAGVGKSRLIAEVLAGIEAADPAPRVLRGRCLSYGDGISYWPLAEVLKAHAGVLDTDPVEVARPRVAEAAEAALAAAGVDAAPAVAESLGASIGLGPPDRAPRSPHELLAETQLAWRAFFSALADAAPSVVIVEDVQWADPAVLDVLEDVADRASGPLLLLSTARPELTDRRPTWGGGRRRFTGLAVEPLAADESARLVDLLADGLSATDRAAMLERAEGNPFFLEEIVRTRALGIPDTVQAALAARIDLLDRGEKRVLQAAAVVGRVFWPEAIAALAEVDAAEVGELLDRLQDRDLVLGRLSSSMSGQREMIFKHALTRDVAYESLPRRDRARMHGDVADWIERAFAGRREEVAELIAHHRQSAHETGASPDRRAAAFAALAEASEGAYARTGFEQARTFARAALGLAETPLERARGLEALGYVSFVLWDGTTTWESLSEAAAILRDEAPDDRARLARVCSFAVMVPTRAQGLMRSSPRPEDVRPLLELGLACAGDEPSEALATLCAAQGYWEFGFGIDPDDDDGLARTRRAAERAREIARSLGRDDLELLAFDSLTAGFHIRGLYGLAHAIDHERLALARRARDPFEVADSYFTVSWSALEVGLYREVVALTEEYDALDAEITSLGQQSLAAVAHFALGEWDEALGDQAAVRELVGDQGADPPRFATAGYGIEALIAELRGDRAASDAAVAEIASWPTPQLLRRDWTSPQLAVVLARRGELAEAERLLDAVATLGVYAVRELEARCTVAAEKGAWADAPELVARCREHARTGRLQALAHHADRLDGRARLASGDAAGALEPLRRAVAGFGELEAAWEVALTELDLAEALFATGDDERARAPLTRAEAVFERLGVPRELERCRALA